MQWGTSKPPVFIRRLETGSFSELGEILEKDPFAVKLLGDDFESSVICSRFEDMQNYLGEKYKGGVFRSKCQSFLNGKGEHLVFQTLNGDVKLLLVSPMRLLKFSNWRRGILTRFVESDYHGWALHYGRAKGYTGVFAGDLKELRQILTLNPNEPLIKETMPKIIGFKDESLEASCKWIEINDPNKL